MLRQTKICAASPMAISLLLITAIAGALCLPIWLMQPWSNVCLLSSVQKPWSVGIVINDKLLNIFFFPTIGARAGVTPTVTTVATMPHLITRSDVPQMLGGLVQPPPPASQGLALA